MAQPKYVDWDGLVYYDGKIKEYVATRDAQGIKMGGVIPFEELPDPSFSNLNYIYKITDGFTSNGDFEKPNLIYKENTWVQCANINNTDTYLYIIFNDNELEGQGGKIDLENYYTKDETNRTFATKVDLDDLSEDLDKAEQGLLDLSADISTNADDIETLKQDLADAEAKVDEIEVTVNSIHVPTKTSDLTNDSGFITEHQDISHLITKEQFEPVQQQSANNDVKLLAVDSELFDIKAQLEEVTNTYATKEDVSAVEEKIPSVDKLATKQELEEAVNAIEIPESELYVVDYNDPKFEEAHKAYHAGKFLLLANAAPDGTGYAVMNYVRDDMITFTKFLMSRKQTHGAFNTYYLSSKNDWQVSKEVRLNVVTANESGEVSGDLKTIKIGSEIYQIPDLTGYATEAFVIGKIAEAELNGGGGDIDLSIYALKSDVPTNVSQLANDKGYITLSDIPEDLITESELDARNFATKDELSSVENKIPNIEGLATEQFVTESIAELTKFDADQYYTSTQTDAAIKEAIDGIDIPEVNLDTYATIDYVDAEVAKIVIPDTSEFIKMADVEAKGYITSDDIPSDESKLDKATYEADKETFATKSEIPTDYLTVADLDGYAKLSDIPTDHITMSDVEAKGYLTATDIENKADKSELTALATKAELEEAVQNVSVDLTGYATEQWVDEQGFLKEHQDLSDYAKKSEIPAVDGFATKTELETVENKIPSVDGLATTDYVDEQINNIDIPDVSNFVTSEVVNELVSAKADDVLFTEDKVVGNAIGLFAIGDPVKGLTIRQLFERILGLTTPVTPEEPEEPSDPDADLTLVEKIIKNELSMYSVTDDGQLVKGEFKTLSVDDEPTESGFIVSYDADGKVVTGGYQELSINNDEMYYVIALPKELDYNTQVVVQAYDPDDKEWNDAELTLTSDPDIVAACCDEVGIDMSHIDTSKYTIWTSEDICTGSILRYIIKE